MEEASSDVSAEKDTLIARLHNSYAVITTLADGLDVPQVYLLVAVVVFLFCYEDYHIYYYY